MGFFNKKPFEGPRFFNPERGAIDRGGGGMILHSRWGGGIGMGGALVGGGGWYGMMTQRNITESHRQEVCAMLIGPVVPRQ